MLYPTTHYRDITEFFNNFANWTHPLDGKVYVIPESEYKDMKRKQALEQIKVLESRALSYENSAISIRKTINELKEEAGLLPADKTEDKETASLDASQN